MTLEQLQADSRSFNEHRDCAVKAVALVSGMRYSLAHTALRLNGRQNRRGTTFNITKAALSDLGYQVEKVDHFRSRTVRTLERELPNQGIYLIRVRGHILCYIDGEMKDWTQGRLHRIREIYKVTKK